MGNIVVNDQEVNQIDYRKDLQARLDSFYGKGHGISLDKPLIFKVHPQFGHQDEDGRWIWPKSKGILPVINVMRNGRSENVRYFSDRRVVGTGNTQTVHYNPETIPIRDGEMIIDLTAPDPDFALAYLMLNHPQLMRDGNLNQPGIFFLYRPEQEAAEQMKKEEARASIDILLVHSVGSKYIKDDKIEAAARRMGLNTAGLEPVEIRRNLLMWARQNSQEFMDKMNSTQGEIVAYVKEAVDLKLLHIEGLKVFYTYRPDETDYKKKRINSAPNFTIRQFGANKPLDDLAEQLADDSDSLTNLMEAVEAEKKYLLSLPDKPNLKDDKKCLERMVGHIVFTN